MSDPLQTLWTNQTEEPFAMSIADIHVRAARFQDRVRGRNWREQIVAAFLVVIFGWIAWIVPDVLVKAGAVLIIVGVIYVSVRLATFARAGSPRDLALAENWVAFYRGELMRQYTALNSLWRWYLGPLVPGMVLVMAGGALTPDNPAPLFAKAIVLSLGLTFAGAVFWGVNWINKVAARRLKIEIDRLDAAQRG